MKKLLAGTGCLLLIIMVPMRMALWFMVLRFIHATDVMWLLFWILIPLDMLGTTVGELLKAAGREED